MTNRNNTNYFTRQLIKIFLAFKGVEDILKAPSLDIIQRQNNIAFTLTLYFANITLHPMTIPPTLSF